MCNKTFPEDSSGMVYGPDGPIRRTRAHVLMGFDEPVEKPREMSGREKAMFDEESAWLSNPHFEE